MRRSMFALAVLAVWPAASALAQTPAGGEFQLNTYTTNGQLHPAVAVDGNGDFVAVWASQGQDGSAAGIFAQRFNAAGARQGAEFRVSTHTIDAQDYPAVAADAKGNFVVVWASRGQDDGTSYGIFGQRFGAQGTPQGPEFRVNTTVTGDQTLPSVSSDASGNFVVVWSGGPQPGSGSDIFGQRYDAAGAPQGGEFLVNSYTTGGQYRPAVAVGAAGNFLVVWSQDPLLADASVKGQRFDALGAPQGGEFQLSAFSTAQLYPSVAAAGNGHFVVAWSTYGDGSYLSVAGRVLDAAGVFLGPDFPINTYTTGPQFRPTVTADRKGGFVVVWNGEDASGDGVSGQQFDPSATPVGGEFPANSFTTGNQSFPSIASDGDGDFVAVWTSTSQDGSGYGTFGQRYGDLIFQDGFEAGSLSRWSLASTDGGDLSISPVAAMGGTGQGLRAVVNDTNPLFVRDDSPVGEPRYRARFYVNTNGFDPGQASGHFRTRIFIAQGLSFRLVTIVLKRQGSAYAIEARVRRNDGSRADTNFVPITDGTHVVEFDWVRSTGPGASDGTFELWIDNVSVATMAGIDNDQDLVAAARLGAMSVKAGASGTLFFDQFESRRQAFIGPE